MDKIWLEHEKESVLVVQEDNDEVYIAGPNMPWVVSLSELEQLRDKFTYILEMNKL